VKVDQLIAHLSREMPVTVGGDGADRTVILGLAYHSARVSPGDLFAALPGTRDDGSRHIPEAVERGASAILHQSDGECKAFWAPPVPLLGVPDVRRALALAADLFWKQPSRETTVVGITGTNGKTTLTYLTEGMVRAAGKRCGVMGTIAYRLGEESMVAEMTTPEAPEFQRILRWMVNSGAQVIAAEVSSHALLQRRVDATRFAFGIFTNLSQDHLDFHGDMESYYRAKRRLFQEFEIEAAVINVDDPWGLRLSGEALGEIITTGHGPQAAIRPLRESVTPAGIRLDLEVPGGRLEVESPLLGAHNALNLLQAAALGWRLGLPGEAIREGLSSVRLVPGRLERVSREGEPLVVVDYAHTPDALEKLLAGTRPLATGKLLLVFGCGGDRDRGKRAVMGAVATAADETFITSDNPRSEDPAAIIGAIETGYRRERSVGCHVVPDRRSAIREAINLAVAGDVVVIAGKGHEDYQILGRERIRFDDREEARRCLDQRAAR
jgi:UDP-N-acetylmuramoyl-L-alanyl-D-glutamate--2,6-diaminopimelate ligase